MLANRLLSSFEPTSPMPLAHHPMKTAKPDTLRILCWEGYDNPALLEPFASERRIETRAETLLSDWDTARCLVAGEAARWDILNINNAYIAKCLHPRGLIRELDPRRFERNAGDRLAAFSRLYRWTRSATGAQIGICQRFGPFNLVVNTDRIDLGSAEDQGFALADDPANEGRFGLLYYEDFNLFHICIGAGIDPFAPLDEAAESAFARTARGWLNAARIVSDNHHALNRALIDGDIDFYLSGGIFTASPARLAGHGQVRAVTPRTGPIGGRGAILFTEITSVLEHAGTSVHAEDFLAYLLSPEAVKRVAFAPGTCNPVAQMENEAVRASFTAEQLNAIQWDTLEEDVARCADYDIMPHHDTLLAVLRTAAGRRRAGA